MGSRKTWLSACPCYVRVQVMWSERHCPSGAFATQRTPFAEKSGATVRIWLESAHTSPQPKNCVKRRSNGRTHSTSALIGGAALPYSS
jgi:hypothetical protein